MLYAIWACGTWSTEEDISEYLTFMSDDYAVLDTEDFWQS
jgi:hypothetical protein